MTAKLSAAELDRLEALAKAAEPIASGSWDVEEGDGSHTIIIRPSAFSTAFVAKTYSRKVAAYIAAANPAVLLRLLGQVKELTTERDYWHSNYDTLHAATSKVEPVLTVLPDAAQAQVREAEWQPIATAPKDGRDILIGWPALVLSAFWSDRRDAWVTAHGEYRTPTHWQPLPPPPARKEGESK